MPDLDAIRARLDRATPGPWTVAETEGWIGIHPVCPPHGTDDAAEISGGLDDLSPADADLIANAPTDLAALLAELRATTADLAVAVEVARERGEEVERLRARICEHAKCPGGSLFCCDHPDVAQATTDLRDALDAWRAGGEG